MASLLISYTPPQSAPTTLAPLFSRRGFALLPRLKAEIDKTQTDESALQQQIGDLQGELQKRRQAYEAATARIAELRSEEQSGVEPADPLTAERIYERRWASTLLDRVLSRLEDKYRARGNAALFQSMLYALAPFA